MAEDAPVQPARSRVRVVMANRQRGATKQMTGRDQRELAAAHRGEPRRTVSRSDHFSSIVFENHITLADHGSGANLGMSEFVDRLRRRTMNEPFAIRHIEPRDRKHGHAVVSVGFSKHEI